MLWKRNSFEFHPQPTDEFKLSSRFRANSIRRCSVYFENLKFTTSSAMGSLLSRIFFRKVRNWLASDQLDELLAFDPTETGEVDVSETGGNRDENKRNWDVVSGRVSHLASSSLFCVLARATTRWNRRDSLEIYCCTASARRSSHSLHFISHFFPRRWRNGSSTQFRWWVFLLCKFRFTFAISQDSIFLF